MFTLFRFIIAATLLVITVVALNIVISGLTVLVGVVASLAAVLTTLCFYIVLTVTSIYASYQFLKRVVLKEK